MNKLQTAMATVSRDVEEEVAGDVETSTAVGVMERVANEATAIYEAPEAEFARKIQAKRDEIRRLTENMRTIEGARKVTLDGIEADRKAITYRCMEAIENYNEEIRAMQETMDAENRRAKEKVASAIESCDRQTGYLKKMIEAETDCVEKMLG